MFPADDTTEARHLPLVGAAHMHWSDLNQRVYQPTATLTMISADTHLQIGFLLYEGLDQIDLTGPFEVLSRLPNSTYRLFAKTTALLRDTNGLRLLADATLKDAPALDVLHVPGGPGQEALMADEETLGWLRHQAAGARCVFSVCTGALICGAAGLLRGRRVTTHWNAFDLLPFFGAVPVNARVVVDGSWVSAAGVSASIDGALRVAAELRGVEVAQRIQLDMVCAPQPPFDSGAPETAPPAVLTEVQRAAWTPRAKWPPGSACQPVERPVLHELRGGTVKLGSARQPRFR